MVHSGHPQKQAVAAALSNARETGHAKYEGAACKERYIAGPPGGMDPGKQPKPRAPRKPKAIPGVDSGAVAWRAAGAGGGTKTPAPGPTKVPGGAKAMHPAAHAAGHGLPHVGGHGGHVGGHSEHGPVAAFGHGLAHGFHHGIREGVEAVKEAVSESGAPRGTVRFARTECNARDVRKDSVYRRVVRMCQCHK
jgi:hypothetical protein